jgi:putative membrane protein
MVTALSPAAVFSVGFVAYENFTIRIGIAAIEVLRPLPYIEARQPRLREFASEFLKVGQKPDTNNGGERG